MNNKGFAITGIMYTLLLLFVVILVGMITMLASRKNILDNIKTETLEKIDNVDKTFVNKPVLASGMTPVKWTGSAWVSTIETDSEWYNYSDTSKRWANAVTDDCTDQLDLSTCSMFVWIPRFAYSITSNYHTSTQGTIEVKFLKDATNVTYDGESVSLTPTYIGSSQTNFVRHPAFNFGSEITGFWVAKFEASANEGLASTSSCSALDNVTTKTVKIVPSVKSWRCISLSNAYKVSLAMKTNPTYGFSTSDIDSHLLKNIEWGAVSYLSQSIYGISPWINNNSNYNTGCSGNTSNAVASATCNEYDSTLGRNASTTGNVYGVYDFAGGAWEHVMAVYNNLVASSGFTAPEFTAIDSKYIDKYTTLPGNMLGSFGMDYDSSIIGDAMYETSVGAARHNGTSWVGTYYSGWSGDYSFLPTNNDSWINRGARQGLENRDGFYAFRPLAGAPSIDLGFRPVLVVN